MRLRGLRDDDGGEGTINYIAVILLVAAVAAAITVVAVPTKVTSGIAAAVCRVAGENCDSTGKPVQRASPGASGPTAPATAPSQGQSPSPGQDGGGTGYEDDPAYQQALQNFNAANNELNNATTDWTAIGKELLDFLADLIGLKDAQKCITQGDILACLMTLVGFLPWGKIFKVFKKIPAAARLIKKFVQLIARLNKARKEKAAAEAALRKAEKEAAERLAKACTFLPNSFVPGTPVLMADGSRRPIERVRVGDLVMATDVRTGRSRGRRVTATFGGHEYTALMRITVDTDGIFGTRTGTVTATEHHRFWDQRGRAWIRADRLGTGSRLRTPGGMDLRVLETAVRPGRPRVHDLTVEGWHDFYVTAGGSDILVHNAGGAKPCNLPAWKKVQIDMDHIKSGHMQGGDRLRQGAVKDVFPEGMTEAQVAKTVRQAYRNGKVLRRQGDRVLVRGEHDGIIVEMWVNTETKTIETAYPVGYS